MPHVQCSLNKARGPVRFVIGTLQERKYWYVLSGRLILGEFTRGNGNEGASMFSVHAVYSMLAVMELERCSRLMNMQEVVEKEISRVDVERDVREQAMQ